MNRVEIVSGYSEETGLPFIKAGEFTRTTFGFLNKTRRDFLGNSEVWQNSSKPKSREWDPMLTGQILGLKISLFKNKEDNQRLAELLGVSPATFCKIWNGKMMETFVYPYKKYLQRLYYPYIRYVQDIDFFWKNKGLIDQLIEDNQEVLIPLYLKIANSGGVSEFRKVVGKSVWKKLLGNSFDRNKHLSRIDTFYLPEVIDCSSTVLSRFATYSHAPEFINWASHAAGLAYKDVSKGIYDMFLDTTRLANQTNQAFNLNWSAKRMKREHDRMSEELLMRKYSPDKWEILSPMVPKYLTHPEFPHLTGKLIDNALELAAEGKAMRHCVASYMHQCRKGEYLVYSIRDSNDNRVSTLGVYSGGVHQHYGSFNTRPRKDASDFISAINIKKITQLHFNSVFIGKKSLEVDNLF